jgi:hypothetical protein
VKYVCKSLCWYFLCAFTLDEAYRCKGEEGRLGEGKMHNM